MADKRITDLPLILSGDISSNDVLPIVDVNLDITNKIEVSQLKSYINSGITTGDTYTISGTYQTGGTLTLNYNTGGNFQITGLTEDLNNEIASLAEADEKTITLNTSTNKIELKEIVESATGGTRTFQGNFAISGGTLNLNTIGSGTSIINLGLDSSGFVVTGTTGGYTYEVGQYVEDQGGVIFHRYLEGGNENYLVVALTDQSIGQAWSNLDNELIGPSAQSLWDGLTNSDAIAAQPGFTNGAAALCLNYAVGAIDGWYLPSIQELNKLWINYLEVSKTLSQTDGATGLELTSYWSSTEYDLSNAWTFSFYLGYVFNGYGKNATNNVRAIRKFSL